MWLLIVFFGIVFAPAVWRLGFLVKEELAGLRWFIETEELLIEAED